jgi:DNA repair exonuclease SbcCD ATPase subunit
MKVVTAVFGIVAPLALANCTKKQEPEKVSKDGLTQALKGVEQAEEGFKGMRERSEALQQKVDEQTKLLDATIVKHVSLLADRADAEDKLLSGLSAEKQTPIRPKVTDLKQQVAGVEAMLREYRDVPSGKLEESKRKIREAIEKLNAAFAQLEAEIRQAAAGQ